MKRFQKIFVLCLACLMVLSLAACGEKDAEKKPAAKDPSVIVSSAPCVLQILTDADVSVAFDENGKALAAVANDAVSDKAVCDVAGKKGSEAVQAVLTAMVDNNYMIDTTYAIIRQMPGTVVPDGEFLDTIAADAKELLKDKPVILISAADMDDDGYCSVEIAQEILEAYLPSSSKVIASSVMIDGCYTMSVEENDTLVDYVVSAFNGSVGLYNDLNPEQLPEDEMVPEDQQFVPEGDTNPEEEPINSPDEEDNTSDDMPTE